MAHTKAQGAVKGNRDSISKRLGIKIYGGEQIKSGNIIVRQRGTKFFAGSGVGLGSDHTLFALVNGIVKFKLRRGKRVVDITS